MIQCFPWSSRAAYIKSKMKTWIWFAITIFLLQAAALAAASGFLKATLRKSTKTMASRLYFCFLICFSSAPC